MLEDEDELNEETNDEFIEKLTSFGEYCKKLNFNFSIHSKYEKNKWMSNLSIYNKSGDKIDNFGNSIDLYDSIVKLFK